MTNFTIITPLHNHENYIHDCIKSVQSQTLKDWKMIIVENGSTDNSYQEALKYTSDERIKVYSLKDKGVANALNFALDLVEDDSWVLWLSSDDILLYDALETYNSNIFKNPLASAFHANVYTFTDPKNLNQESWVKGRGKWIPNSPVQTIQFFNNNWVHGISACVHASILKKLKFDTSLKWATDVKMWAKVSMETPFYFIDKETCATREHDNSVTNSFPEACHYDMANWVWKLLTPISKDLTLFPYLLQNGENSINDDNKELIYAEVLNVIFTSGANMYSGTNWSPLLLDIFLAWVGQKDHNECVKIINGMTTRGVLSPPWNRIISKHKSGDHKVSEWNLLSEWNSNRSALYNQGNEWYSKIQKYMNHYIDQDPSDIKNIVNISLITFNRLEYTKQCINSILSTGGDFPWVLTVVDNGSTDGTIEYLQSLKDSGVIKTLVLNGENLGVAKAANIGWSTEPNAAYYLKVDNDIVFQRQGWLSELVDAFNKDPMLGAAGINLEPYSYNPAENKLRYKSGGNLGGAVFMIPISTSKKIGHWCEDYGLYSEEDADYCHRLRLVNLGIAYIFHEDIAFHLPAGKAAVIDPSTLNASDGKEEIHEAEYRKFKDDCRREALHSGKWNANIEGYNNKTKDIQIFKF